MGDVLTHAGYSQPLSFMGPLASHLQVEAIKSAFALRTHLGDPGTCSNAANCFLDLEALMNDTLSLEFADSLRWVLPNDTLQSVFILEIETNLELDFSF